MIPNENAGPTVITIYTVLTLLSALTVSLRIFVRVKIVRSFGLDDVFISFAMVWVLCQTHRSSFPNGSQMQWLAVFGITIASVKYGTGRHAIYLDKAATIQALKYNFISQPLVSWTLCSVKISICLLLVRITPRRTYRRIFHGTAIFVLAYTVALFIATVNQCKPLEAAWNNAIRGVCYSHVGTTIVRYMLTGTLDIL